MSGNVLEVSNRSPVSTVSVDGSLPGQPARIVEGRPGPASKTGYVF